MKTRWLIKMHLAAKIIWNLPSKRFQFTPPPFSRRPSKFSLEIVQILMRLFNSIFIINVKRNANMKKNLSDFKNCLCFTKGGFVLSVVGTWLQRSFWGIQKFLKSCLNAPEIRTNVKKDNHLPQISCCLGRTEDWKNIPKILTLVMEWNERREKKRENYFWSSRIFRY